MRFSILLLLAGILLSGCNDSTTSDAVRPEAKGGRVYGGTLRINENDPAISLYPHRVTDVVSIDIAYQIYDGLVRIDAGRVTNILPGIAEKWDESPDGKVYTFHLRKGVFFHDNPCFPDGKGREIKAQDFNYSFEMLCTPSEDNSLPEFRQYVLGASEYYESLKKGNPMSDIEGVKVIDDYTLQITLKDPFRPFLFVLAGPAGFVMAKEAVEKYGNKMRVGAGPFMYSNESTDDQVILLKNPHYYRTDSVGNTLPFLDSLIICFIPGKKEEMEAFEKDSIQLIFGLPSSSISSLVESQISDFNSKNPKFILQRNAQLSTQYYQFNILRKPYDNIKVRQALSYAIDRDKIISDVLNSEAFGPGICGITSPGISGYDITLIKGYPYNPEKARKLLAEAGYPDGKGFPTVNIEVNSGGGKYADVVEEIKKQLHDVLNIEVDYTIVPFLQKIEDSKYGRGDIFRSGWFADYPSPYTYLMTFYGKSVPDSMNLPSYPNTVRYRNARFDSLLLRGAREVNIDSAYTYYRKAEQQLMDDAPVIILWYDEGFKLIHSYVRNFHFNPMNFKDFSEVYLKKNSTRETP